LRAKEAKFEPRAQILAARGLKFKNIVADVYSKFPSVSRDLSILVPSGMRFEQIKQCIDALKIEALKEFIPSDLYSDESLGDSKSLTIRLVFQDLQKTLCDEEVAHGSSLSTR